MYCRTRLFRRRGYLKEEIRTNGARGIIDRDVPSCIATGSELLSGIRSIRLIRFRMRGTFAFDLVLLLGPSGPAGLICDSGGSDRSTRTRSNAYGDDEGGLISENHVLMGIIQTANDVCRKTTFSTIIWWHEITTQ